MNKVKKDSYFNCYACCIVPKYGVIVYLLSRSYCGLRVT